MTDTDPAAAGPPNQQAEDPAAADADARAQAVARGEAPAQATEDWPADQAERVAQANQADGGATPPVPPAPEQPGNVATPEGATEAGAGTEGGTEGA